MRDGTRCVMIEISLEKLADAVAALRNEIWHCPEQERRSLPRIRVWAPRTIHLRVAGTASGAGRAGTTVDVWLVDLACGGVSFLSPRTIPVDTEFTLTLPAMESAATTLHCKVLHCQPAPNGSYLVGARFLSEAPDTAQPSPAAAADR